jgi:hypothetical protein
MRLISLSTENFEDTYTRKPILDLKVKNKIFPHFLQFSSKFGKGDFQNN